MQIFDKPLLTGNTLQTVIEFHFNAGCTSAIDIGSSYQLRDNLACRVKTSILPLPVDPRNVRGHNSTRNRWRLMTREVHKLLISVSVELR